MRRSLVLILLTTASLTVVSAQEPSAPQLMATTCANERTGAEIEVVSPAERIDALIKRLERAGFSCESPEPSGKALPTI